VFSGEIGEEEEEEEGLATNRSGKKNYFKKEGGTRNIPESGVIL